MSYTLNSVRVLWDSQLRVHIAQAIMDGRPYTILIEGPEMEAALNGEPVTPSQTPASIEADLLAGRYTLQFHHDDLECIDLDVRLDRLLYAVPHK